MAEIEQKPPVVPEAPIHTRQPTPAGKPSKVQIKAPETDEVMYSAPDHAGIESLTKPFTYRGQRFGVGDHVDSVKRAIERREKQLKEERGERA
jgi:hypothetical protein